MAVSFQCMTKSTTKKKKRILRDVNHKKKKNIQEYTKTTLMIQITMRV